MSKEYYKKAIKNFIKFSSNDDALKQETEKKKIKNVKIAYGIDREYKNLHKTSNKSLKEYYKKFKTSKDTTWNVVVLIDSQFVPVKLDKQQSNGKITATIANVKQKKSKKYILDPYSSVVEIISALSTDMSKKAKKIIKNKFVYGNSKPISINKKEYNLIIKELSNLVQKSELDLIKKEFNRSASQKIAEELQAFKKETSSSKLEIKTLDKKSSSYVVMPYNKKSNNNKALDLTIETLEKLNRDVKKDTGSLNPVHYNPNINNTYWMDTLGNEQGLKAMVQENASTYQYQKLEQGFIINKDDYSKKEKEYDSSNSPICRSIEDGILTNIVCSKENGASNNNYNISYAVATFGDKRLVVICNGYTFDNIYLEKKGESWTEVAHDIQNPQINNVLEDIGVKYVSKEVPEDRKIKHKGACGAESFLFGAAHLLGIEIKDLKGSDLLTKCKAYISNPSQETLEDLKTSIKNSEQVKANGNIVKGPTAQPQQTGNKTI